MTSPRRGPRSWPSRTRRRHRRLDLFEVNLGARSTEYQVTLMVKLLLVAVTGIGAAVHRATSSRTLLVVGGAAAAVGALGALFLGVQLHG